MTSTVSKKLRHQVAERDSYTCVLCENHYSDMHHVRSRSLGGKNTPHNLVSLCRMCHMRIHRELPEPWEGWREEAEQKLIEYVDDYYAEEIETGKSWIDTYPRTPKR